MNRSLGPIWSILLACILLFNAGYEIHTGHATMGRHLHHSYSMKIDPHGFWNIVIFQIAVGIIFVGLGIYQFLRGQD